MSIHECVSGPTTEGDPLSKNTVYNTLPNWVWMYSGSNMGWWLYDNVSQDLIEQSYKTQDRQIILYVCGDNFQLNFDTMDQNNTSTGSQRRIMRVSLNELRSTHCNWVIKGINGNKFYHS